MIAEITNTVDPDETAHYAFLCDLPGWQKCIKPFSDQAQSPVSRQILLIMHNHYAFTSTRQLS